MNKQDRGTGIVITDRAAKRIKEILLAEEEESRGLRIEVVGRVPSGLQYEFDLDIERAGDHIFEKDRARVLINANSFLYLKGTELDYKEGLAESGLVLKSPQVERSCRCSARCTLYPETPDLPNIW